MKIILIAQLLSTLFMVGLIWFVQVVHYPLFRNVGTDQFVQYEFLHQKLTTWVVGPAMLLELITAVALVKFSAPDSTLLPWIGVGLVGIIWISTAALQVPAHNSLSVQFSADACSMLVNTNWIRTVAWSARGILVLILTYRRLV